jgi:DNA-binding beta-propeller fold protein YncE
MRSWLVIFLWIALAGRVVFAQDETPPLGAIGALEAGDFRALAVTADGDRLLVADSVNKQIRIYDFSDPANPALLSTLDVSGTPVLLAGGEGYGLVAVTTEADTDAFEVVAPILPGTSYATGIYFTIPKNPRSLALSPDNHWGIIVSEQGYVLLGINAPDDIESIPVEATVIDAALSDTTAYLLRDQVLETAPLGALHAIQAARELALDGTPSLVRLNHSVTEGVIVLDGSHLEFFDPSSLEQTGEFSVEGSPITDVRFLSDGDSEYLLVTQADANTITVLDATDPQNVQILPSTPPLDNPVQALTVFDHYLIVTDGATIRILST